MGAVDKIKYNFFFIYLIAFNFYHDPLLWINVITFKNKETDTHRN